MTTRDDMRVAKALQGADFPASAGELVRYARSRGADQKSVEALQSLPERQFENMTQVTEAVPQEPEGRQRPGGTAR